MTFLDDPYWLCYVVLEGLGQVHIFDYSTFPIGEQKLVARRYHG